jgi:undecaprenyl-diphosphatase
MTAMNGIGPQSSAAAVWRRAIGNLVGAVKILLRPAYRKLRFGPPDAYKLLAGAGVAIVLLAAGIAFIDAPVSNAAKHLPRWVITFFEEITDFGKGAWFAWPLGILFVALAAMAPSAPGYARKVLATIMVRVGFLFVAIGLPGLFATLIKNMIGRARPSLSGVSDPTLFDPFHWSPAFASLPSGHATTAFAALAAIGSLWPRWRTELLIYALLIAVSRVVILAHYPTDVAAGALVGIGGVWLIRRWFAARRLGFSIGPDGHLHLFPGPSAKRIKAVARALLAE